MGKTMRSVWVVVAGMLAWSSAVEAYPVSVRSCNDVVSFSKAPSRGIVGSSNMVQTVVDLGLLERFVGIAELGDTFHHVQGSPEVLAELKRKSFAPRKARMEAILDLQPDFYFSGWLYGFSEASGVTPATLAKFKIGTYALNESCIRIGPRAPLSMESVYTDIRALGQIFDIMPRAEALIAGQRRKVEDVARRVAKVQRRYRVMYCSGCLSKSPPRSTGSEGFPKVLIEAAGGEHVFNDIKDSYLNVSWEALIARDPEWMIIDPAHRPPSEVIAYLTGEPLLKNVTAVKNRNFIFLTYPEFEPSTRNAEAIERIARLMYPELFPK